MKNVQGRLPVIHAGSSISVLQRTTTKHEARPCPQWMTSEGFECTNDCAINHASVFFAWKDSKTLSYSLLSSFADNVGAYMVTKFVKSGVVHFCIEWST